MARSRRWAESLPDKASAIRGGFNSRTQLKASAERCFAAHGFYAVSVFSADGESIERLAEIAGFGYPMVRVSTVGRIRAAGFDVVPEGRYGHGQVVFPDVTNTTLDRFRRAFGSPIPNPALPEEANP